MNDKLHLADCKVPKFTFDGTCVDAKITKVYDGDTMWAVFWFNNKLQRFSIRMFGYNCAEVKSKNAEEKQCGINAKAALSELVLDKIVTLQLGDFDKYGRILGTVIIDSLNVNEFMVANGYGKPYLGCGEKEW